MKSVVLALLGLAGSPTLSPQPPSVEKGHRIELGEFAELHRHPVDSYECSNNADGRAFAGLTRAKALELFGEPDEKSQPIGRGLDWQTSWTYYVTRERNRITGGDSPPSARFVLSFGPGDVVHAVSCFSHSHNKAVGWSNSLIVYSEPESPERKRKAAASIDQIRAILYSTRSREQMLKDLGKFVKPGRKIKRFERDTGLSGFCVGGLGVTCAYSEVGLELMTDEADRIRLIHRTAATIGGVEYPALWLTDRGFMDEDYGRWFEE